MGLCVICNTTRFHFVLYKYTSHQDFLRGVCGVGSINLHGLPLIDMSMCNQFFSQAGPEQCVVFYTQKLLNMLRSDLT